MKRQATEKERELLKNSRKDIISGVLELEKGNGVLPIILGFAFGLAAGIPIVFALRNTDERVIKGVYTICVVIGFNVFFGFWKKVLGVTRKRKVLKKGTFEINGGTIVKVISDMGSERIMFFEDDLLDDCKRPYLINFPLKNLENLKAGDRILLVYGSHDAYVPMRINEQTKDMIPSTSPACVSKVEWGCLREIPHPSVIELDERPRLLNENGKREFAKKWKRDYSVGKKIAAVLLSVLIFLIMGIAFCAMVAGDIIRQESFEWTLVAFVLGWIFLTWLMVLLIRFRDKKVIEKVTHQQTVMFYSYDTYFDGKLYTAQLNVYEIEGDKLVFNTYSIHNNAKLPKNTAYGARISKYTGEKFMYFTT